VEIRHLRNFVVLAEELHFGRAATRLHIAQSAVSQQLMTLERELGLRLIDRTNRRAVLTDAGVRLVAEANAVLARYDAAVAAMAKVRSGSVGRLTLGVSPGIDPLLLSGLLAAAGEGAEAPEIEPRTVTSPEALAALARAELDAALVHVVPEQPGIARVVLAREPLGVALPSSHRLARRRAVSPAELSGEPFIWMRRGSEPDLYDQVLATLEAAAFLRGPARETPNVETSLSLVAAGLGISLKMAHEVARGRHVGVVWRPFKGVQPVIPTILAWRAGDRAPILSRLVRAAYEWADRP